jgi:hypothetical protein
MGKREYCRRRGAAPSSLRYQIRMGRVIPDRDTGLIDVRQADAAWPLDRRHGPAWVLGPSPAVPPAEPMESSAVDRAWAAGDYMRAFKLMGAELSDSAAELARLLSATAKGDVPK